MDCSRQADLFGSSDRLEYLFKPGNPSPPTSSDALFDVNFPRSLSTSTDTSELDLFLRTDLFFPEDLTAYRDPFARTDNAHPEPGNSIQAPATTCSCVPRALDLMSRLLLASSSVPLFVAKDGCEVSAIRTIADAIAQSKAAIDALRSILECAGSHDGYFFALMSLVIFKAIDLYEATARELSRRQYIESCQTQQPSSKLPFEGSTFGSIYGNGTNGEESSRTTTQRVLGELYHARRLIDQISTKLQMQEVEATRAQRVGEMTLPPSAALNSDVVGDMRRLLKALSCKLIDRLKRY